MEERDDWEKLNHIMEEYEPNPDLAYRAIEKINQREATVVFKKAPNKQTVLALSIVGVIIVVFLAIFLPLYLTRNRVQILLYSADDVEISEISDLNGFTQQNNLDIKYFSESLNCKVATIKENGNLAYIMQDKIFIANTDFDIVNLKVVVLKNAEFEFYKRFNANTQTVNINSIKIDYKFDSENSQNVVNAKFDYQNNSYFLEIKTADSATEAIEKYVNLLLN